MQCTTSWQKVIHSCVQNFKDRNTANQKLSEKKLIGDIALVRCKNLQHILQQHQHFAYGASFDDLVARNTRVVARNLVAMAKSPRQFRLQAFTIRTRDPNHIKITYIFQFSTDIVNSEFAHSSWVNCEIHNYDYELSPSGLILEGSPWIIFWFMCRSEVFYILHSGCCYLRLEYCDAVIACIRWWFAMKRTDRRDIGTGCQGCGKMFGSMFAYDKHQGVAFLRETACYALPDENNITVTAEPLWECIFYVFLFFHIKGRCI